MRAPRQSSPANPYGQFSDTVGSAISGELRQSTSYSGKTTYGGPSASFAGMDAVVGPGGVVTVSDDNMSFIDNSRNVGGKGFFSRGRGRNKDAYAAEDFGGEGGGPGGTVLCTLAYEQGRIPPHVYASDAAFGDACPRWLIQSYHFWAKPLVRLCRRNKAVSAVVMPVITIWAWSMHAFSNVARMTKHAAKCQRLERRNDRRKNAE